MVTTLGLWSAAEEVDRLLEDGAGLQERTPMAQMLLDKSADLSVKREFGRTQLLFAAIMGGHRTIVQCCLDKGADVNVKIGLTPLLVASERGDDAIVHMLLNNGADLHSITHDGQTALHRAAQRGHGGIVTALLQNSADVRARTSSGMTPEDLASVHGQDGVAAVHSKP